MEWRDGKHTTIFANRDIVQLFWKFINPVVQPKAVDTFPHKYVVNGQDCAAKSLQLCLTLCDCVDGSPPGSPIPGILQARTLEWVAISFSSAWKWKVKVKLLSRVCLFPTPWTAAYQAPPSMGFSRQEYWIGVPLPSPEWTRRITKMLSALQIRFTHSKAGLVCSLFYFFFFSFYLSCLLQSGITNVIYIIILKTLDWWNSFNFISSFIYNLSLSLSHTHTCTHTPLLFNSKRFEWCHYDSFIYCGIKIISDIR